MKVRLLIFSLCLLGYNSFSQTDVTSSRWVNKPIVIEPQLSDFGQPFNLYDSDSKVYFDISNDSSNLYICFKITDFREQMKIVKAGMKVSFTAKASKKRKASIIFPLKSEDEPIELDRSQISGNRTFDPNDLRNRVKLNNTMMEIHGFTSFEGLTNINSKNEVNVGIDWDTKKAMYYQIIIPFSEFFGEKYTKNDLASTINMLVNVNELSRPSNSGGESHGGRPGSGMRGGGGGMGRGGMGHGGRSGGGMDGGGSGEGYGSGERSSGGNMFSSQKFNQKFVLTFKH